MRRQKTWVLGSETFPISSVLLPLHVTGAPSPTAPPPRVIPSPPPPSSSPIVPPPVRLRSTPDTVPSSGPPRVTTSRSRTSPPCTVRIRTINSAEPSSPTPRSTTAWIHVRRPLPAADAEKEAVGARAVRQALFHPPTPGSTRSPVAPSPSPVAPSLSPAN